MHEIFNEILNAVSHLGYFGIFIGMALESTIIPLPSEIIMIPAGYLVFTGKMSFFLASFSGASGSLFGASINYFVAKHCGLPFLKKYGKYFLLPQTKLDKVSNFFNKHGAFSTFIGRFIPVIRHFISIPAGIAKMPFYLFSIYTLVGSFLWSAVLVYFGMFLGKFNSSFGEISSQLELLILDFIIIGILSYILWIKIKENKNVVGRN